VRTHLCATFPFEEACEAHRLMESSRHIGKIVLQIDSSATGAFS
jgi:NADPH2:quinone reductase